MGNEVGRPASGRPSSARRGTDPKAASGPIHPDHTKSHFKHQLACMKLNKL